MAELTLGHTHCAEAKSARRGSPEARCGCNMQDTSEDSSTCPQILLAANTGGQQQLRGRRPSSEVLGSAQFPLERYPKRQGGQKSLCTLIAGREGTSGTGDLPCIPGGSPAWGTSPGILSTAIFPALGTLNKNTQRSHLACLISSLRFAQSQDEGQREVAERFSTDI